MKGSCLLLKVPPTSPHLFLGAGGGGGSLSVAASPVPASASSLYRLHPCPWPASSFLQPFSAKLLERTLSTPHPLTSSVSFSPALPPRLVTLLSSFLERLLLRFFSAPSLCPLCRPRLAPRSWLQSSSLLSGCFSCSFQLSQLPWFQSAPRTPMSVSSYHSPEPQTLEFDYEPSISSWLSLRHLHPNCCHYLLPYSCFSPTPWCPGQKSGHHS